MPALRWIDVEADNGTVVIRGQVRSFYQKQLCINCSRRVAGVVRLIDEVKVVPGREAGVVGDLETSGRSDEPSPSDSSCAMTSGSFS